MEQVFVLVNDLLRQDVETRRRKLHIRTYKVIPLQGQHGLLEFVANTAPLGSCLSRLYESVSFTLYLVPLSAHEDFLMSRQMQPGMPARARSEMSKIERTHKPNVEVMKSAKLAAFEKTLKEMHPLMRHLFWQRQKVPSLWFDMRLNYSRSVATTSMIGYVLGLGDRHVSNILMDEATGELVHIDFGIAFEQVSSLYLCTCRALTPNLIMFVLTHRGSVYLSQS